MDDADLTMLRQNRYTSPHVATLLVSVFLLLLSFFIALCSLADFNADRSSNVLNSVNKTFSRSSGKTSALPPPANSVAPVTVKQIFDDVQNSVARVIPLYEMKREMEGNTLRLILPSTHLYLRGTANLRKDRIDFYQALSEALGRWQNTAEISMNMIQGMEKATGAEAEANREMAITRGGNFARFLENRGVPPRHIRIAISDRSPDTITLIFDIASHGAEGAVK